MSSNGLSLLISVILGVATSTVFAAEPNWVGEYADKNFLNGQAVLQMSIEQSGNMTQVSFDAVYSDGHGAAPEGQGPAKITGNGTLEFKWEDSFKNSGTGTISRTSDGIRVSMKTTRVADSRCLVFYGQNMQLRRAKK